VGLATFRLERELGPVIDSPFRGPTRPTRPWSISNARSLADSETIEVPSAVYHLFRDVSIWKKAGDVVAPLVTDGVDRLDFWTTRA
jgi:hypothetical protein